MQFDNATNLYRKSAVRGTKKMGAAPSAAFAPGKVQPDNDPSNTRKCV
jgi:hypothetical protein